MKRPSPGGPSVPTTAKTPVAPAVAPAAGPWYTCGLGGGLLAKNAALFWVLTGLTYAAGLWLLAYLLLFLYLWWLLASCAEACSQACGTCTCASPEPDDDGCILPCGGGSSGGKDDGGDRSIPGFGAAGGLAATLAALGIRRLPSLDLSHHPDLPAFAADVWRIGARRVCVGCSVVYPVFFVSAAALVLAPLPIAWTVWLAGGTALASAQALSALGWTRWRWLKASVKACLGAGLAMAMHGILASPWPNLVQGAALTVLVALAGLSALPRRRRIARALAGL